MTASSVVPTTKFLFAACDCTVDGDVGTGEFSLALRILHLCGYTHVQAHVSPG